MPKVYTSAPPSTLEGLPAQLEVALARALGASVNVVVLNRAPVDLVHRVMRDGILVCDRDASKRVAFEVQARNAYWDLLENHLDDLVDFVRCVRQRLTLAG